MEEVTAESNRTSQEWSALQDVLHASDPSFMLVLRHAQWVRKDTKVAGMLQWLSDNDR